MREKAKREILAILDDYPNYEYYIKKQELEILYPVELMEDKNIGGGRSTAISNPTQQRAVRLAEDKTIRRLKEQKQAVENVLSEMNKKESEVIKLYYFQKPRTKTWDGVAIECNFSKRTCLYIRDRFFDRMADELGILK